MLTFEQIKELIDLVASHRLTGVELERSGFRLKVDGYKPGKAVGMPSSPPAEPAPAGPAAVALPAAPPPPEPAAPEAETADADLAGATIMTSPIVGTFYQRPPVPDADPYVEGRSSRVERRARYCALSRR